MFEHLGRGLMRTLISYSDLCCLGWGKNRRGFAENALKDEVLGFVAQDSGARATGIPQTKALVPALGWKITFFRHFWGGEGCEKRLRVGPRWFL